MHWLGIGHSREVGSINPYGVKGTLYLDSAEMEEIGADRLFRSAGFCDQLLDYCPRKGSGMYRR